MKSWMLLPFALILGWIMGSWLPKAELRAARRELASARVAVKTQAPRGGQLTGVTQILGIEDAAREQAKSVSTNLTEEPAPAAVAGEGPQAAANADKEKPDEASKEETPRRRNRGQSMAENIQKAMDVWDARVGIARSTFVSNAGLSQRETEHFDVVVDAMNIRLAHHIEEFAQHVNSGRQVGEPEAIKLVSNLTAAMAGTYDEMDAGLPKQWREDSGKGFSLTDFVDPAVALPLTELEDQLDGNFFMGGR